LRFANEAIGSPYFPERADNIVVGTAFKNNTAKTFFCSPKKNIFLDKRNPKITWYTPGAVVVNAVIVGLASLETKNLLVISFLKDVLFFFTLDLFYVHILFGKPLALV
jgi:hypothetical protein